MLGVVDGRAIFYYFLYLIRDFDFDLHFSS